MSSLLPAEGKNQHYASGMRFEVTVKATIVGYAQVGPGAKLGVERHANHRKVAVFQRRDYRETTVGYTGEGLIDGRYAAAKLVAPSQIDFRNHRPELSEPTRAEC